VRRLAVKRLFFGVFDSSVFENGEEGHPLDAFPVTFAHHALARGANRGIGRRVGNVHDYQGQEREVRLQSETLGNLARHPLRSAEHQRLQASKLLHVLAALPPALDPVAALQRVQRGLVDESELNEAGRDDARELRIPAGNRRQVVEVDEDFVTARAVMRNARAKFLEISCT
jgi:hypothetical protein